jgi:hypothetical protein
LTIYLHKSGGCNNEEKFEALEKEAPDEMEVAAQAHEKGAQAKIKKSCLKNYFLFL